MKVNAINRRALAVVRQARPNLSVVNFMRNRAPHRRREKKNNTRKNNAKNKALRNYYEQKPILREQELLAFKPNVNQEKYDNFFRNRS